MSFIKIQISNGYKKKKKRSYVYKKNLNYCKVIFEELCIKLKLGENVLSTSIKIIAKNIIF